MSERARAETWTMMASYCLLLLLLPISCLCGDPSTAYSNSLQQTNLLFIMHDDLRPELSIYGKSHILSPNYERLSKRSVTFDLAVSQIAVCNPSRTSMLTGLRPDTTATYGFQHGYKPYLLWPTELSRRGYSTSSFGKMLHFDGADKEVWNTNSSFAIDGMHWYVYQAKEDESIYTAKSNATIKIEPGPHNEDKLPDHTFTTMAIDHMKSKQSSDDGRYWMLSVGYKLPHTRLHVPEEYYVKYRSLFDNEEMLHKEGDNSRMRALHRQSSSGMPPPSSIRATNDYLSWPANTTLTTYRCCAQPQYKYYDMDARRRRRQNDAIAIKDKSSTIADKKKAKPIDRFGYFGNVKSPHMETDMYREVMIAYCAAVSFLDAQLGRILDTLDELNLWNNVTIVLSSDHGMHNGEKGVWGKWTLFDESTRVPLLIYHPQSPYQNTHHEHPVELVDIYPTLLDLLNPPPFNKAQVYNARKTRFQRKYLPLAGRSLAYHVIGPQYHQYFTSHERVADYGKHRIETELAETYPLFKPVDGKKEKDGVLSYYKSRKMFSVSQSYLCTHPLLHTPKYVESSEDLSAVKQHYQQYGKAKDRNQHYDERRYWDCDVMNKSSSVLKAERAFMVYSLRSRAYRYTVMVPFHRMLHIPLHSMAYYANKIDIDLQQLLQASHSLRSKYMVNSLRKDFYFATAASEQPWIVSNNATTAAVDLEELFQQETLYAHDPSLGGAVDLGLSELVNLAPLGPAQHQTGSVGSDLLDGSTPASQSESSATISAVLHHFRVYLVILMSQTPFKSLTTKRPTKEEALSAREAMGARRRERQKRHYDKNGRRKIQHTNMV